MPEFCDIDATYKLADNLLNVLAKGASDRLGGIEFGRAYVAFDEPVADVCCDGGQLTVHATNIRPSVDNYGDGTVCVTGWEVDLVVTTYQCYPTGVLADGETPIPAAEMDTASEYAYRVGHALYYTAFKAVTDGTVYPDGEIDRALMRKPVRLGDLQALSQQETCVGWRFTLTLDYDI